MKAAYELRREFSKSPEGHCKGGANDTIFSSDAVRPGSMNGLKDEGNAGSFGSAGDIVKQIKTMGLTPLKKQKQPELKHKNKMSLMFCKHRIYVKKHR